MFTKIMKWASITVLLLAAFWLPSTGFQILLELVICVSALLVVRQAFRVGRYAWAFGFLTIAALFNPVVPIVLSRRVFLGLDWLCLMTFLISLAVLSRSPVLSIPSITGRTPGSVSL
jgi:uncharacterized protein DUF6804